MHYVEHGTGLPRRGLRAGDGGAAAVAGGRAGAGLPFAAGPARHPAAQLARTSAEPYDGPASIIAGRLDSTVGFAAAVDLLDDNPHASLAVVDDAGHALAPEQPGLLRALLAEWLSCVEQSR